MCMSTLSRDHTWHMNMTKRSDNSLTIFNDLKFTTLLFYLCLSAEEVYPMGCQVCHDNPLLDAIFVVQMSHIEHVWKNYFWRHQISLSLHNHQFEYHIFLACYTILHTPKPQYAKRVCHVRLIYEVMAKVGTTTTCSTSSFFSRCFIFGHDDTKIYAPTQSFSTSTFQDMIGPQYYLNEGVLVWEACLPQTNDPYIYNFATNSLLSPLKRDFL